ncbi:integrase [Pseudomonas fluorescens]|uniref:integrase n=1 Tax=Pseudomonas fluorescens TaxID=294 RepID=UPI000AC4C52B|nr:integrase [Pseudomonas fluorescens]
MTELAQLEIGSVLFPSGAVRLEVYLYASITKHSRARSIYLTHPKCLEALERWLEVRVNRRWGYSGAAEYRGLRPGLKLVMTFKGEAFELAFKHRMLESGPEVYRCCDSLQRTFSRFIAKQASRADCRTAVSAP